MGTYAKAVDRYIALSEFARNKFIEGGLPAEKISIKPNFLVHDPGYCEGRGTYALFVGRLSEEKGVRPLLNAWSSLNHPLLRIVGDGPLAGEVQAAAASFPDRIVWEGSQPRERVYHLMQQAMFLVLPSICYENFPMTVVEAFACGTPILASKIGSLAEIVCDRRTGLHFRPGDPEDLAGRVRWLLAHSDELARMRRAARAEYEAKYTAERNYEMLMAIYEQAIAQKAETS
ncbi:MAG: hypothetical protein KatS3mg043_1722 [Rhodothermaceae bacterium]|nr:MAG: hypothetical protein KatS3mg043_1722 [Rhodothermaceae bacterium]